MKRRTQQQLRALSLAFYEAHAQAFDASRVELPWPGWERVVAELAHERPTASPPSPTPASAIRVLDIGCGNGRFASYLENAGLDFDFTGVDANAGLLHAARTRVSPALSRPPKWIQHDFLAAEPAGSQLPEGPFDGVVLMGVLHHVPGREARLELLESAARRLGPGGLLAFTTWQFAEQPRFHRRMVDWASVRTPDGSAVELTELEPGDHLMRFGDDPASPPRYCHQVSDDEFEHWPEAIGLEPICSYRADGAQGELNRYGLLRAR